jgi:hypothetical protein
MNNRQRFMVRAAVLYAIANLDDLNEAFEEHEDFISVNGDIGKMLLEDDVEELLKLFQD